MIFSSSFSDYLYNKSKTPTRREHSWGKAIWGPMYRQTDGQTDGRTKSFIEVLCLRLKAGKVFTLDSTKRRMKSMQALWTPSPGFYGVMGYGLDQWAVIPFNQLLPDPSTLHLSQVYLSINPECIPSSTNCTPSSTDCTPNSTECTQSSTEHTPSCWVYSKFNWVYSEFNRVYSQFNWMYSNFNWV